MSVEINEVPQEHKALKKYVRFGINLYRGNPCYVPPLVLDEINTLLPDHNPAYDYCTSKSWMAYRDGKPVGRITGIVNSVVNERTGRRDCRFGWIDFIDDIEVVDALFATLSEWAKSQGLDALVGPMGFTDMDHEGALTFGYDEMGTMATIYNHPYYIDHYRRLGFSEDAEWLEYRITIPTEVPDKMSRVAAVVRDKLNLRTVKYKSAKKLKNDYGVALFDLINEAYDKLYGYSPLSPRQIQYYINMYLPVLRLDNVCVIVDTNDKLVGLGIALPSLSKALQRAKGRFRHMGWLHLLHALYGRNEVVDLMLVAVSADYLNKGVNALLFDDLIPVFIKQGYRFAESNPELSTNESVQSQWKFFERRQHRRRAAFRKSI